MIKNSWYCHYVNAKSFSLSLIFMMFMNFMIFDVKINSAADRSYQLCDLIFFFFILRQKQSYAKLAIFVMLPLMAQQNLMLFIGDRTRV